VNDVATGGTVGLIGNALLRSKRHPVWSALNSGVMGGLVGSGVRAGIPVIESAMKPATP